MCDASGPFLDLPSLRSFEDILESRRDARFFPCRPSRDGTVHNGIQSQHVALALPPEFITMSVVRLEDRHEYSEHEDGGRGERQSEPCT